MALGPGKYDELCTYVRLQASAAGAIVIVFGGDKGTGFSMQAEPALTLTVPAILERVAREIRESLEAEGSA